MSDRTNNADREAVLVKGITGIILAGGKSSRYGKNKALVKMNGTPLIERVLAVMGSVFENLLLITNSPEEYAHLKLPMKQDLIRGLGPIGGIYTGLESISQEAGFFVACDMPFLNESLMRHILAVRGQFDAVVPRVDWKIEALQALYSKNCLPAIRFLIESGEYQVIKFFDMVRTRYVDEAEIRVFDPQLRSFANVNRPEELEITRRLEGS